MYIFKNAFRCISRAKGRNIIIGLVVVLLSVSSCIGLSIKEANKTLKKQYANDMEITATLNAKSRDTEITLDTLQKLAEDETVKDFNKTASLYFSAGDGIEPIDVAGSFKQNKDFKAEFGDMKPGESTTTSSTESSVQTQSNNGYTNKVTLLSDTSSEQSQTSENQSPTESAEENTSENQSQENQEAQEDKKDNEKENGGNNQGGFTPPSGSDSQTPNGSSDSSDGNSFGTPPNMGGGDTFITNNFFFNMASMNDFTVVGADEDSLPEYIAELDALDLDSADYKCVISKNLADENELKEGDTFTLKNPENEDEVYTFTIAGIADSSKSSESGDSSSNASFTDNNIYVSNKTVEDIVSKSSELNGDATVEDKEDTLIALSPSYSGTFVFANMTDYETFSENVSDTYSVVSEDVSNYEQSISQLETLGKYATYFLIVIFLIGAFVLVIINLFSIRNRKYEIGVLTAIGMKKYKVGLQFVVELFVVTFVALIIGSSAGAISSVPVTNKLLQTVNSTSVAEENDASNTDNKASNETKSDTKDSSSSSEMPSMPGGGFDKDNFGKGNMPNFKGMANNYIASINSATNLTVILEMIGVGIILTLISSIASMIIVMRYEPLKILSNRE